MQTIYQGNLNPLIDSLATLIGEEKITLLKENLQLLLGSNYSLNVNNLLNIHLNNLLGLMGVVNFPTDENGLVPNYAGYYLNRSLHQLVDDLTNTFQFDLSSETSLKKYLIDFRTVKDLIATLLYDNKINSKKGFLADFLSALIKQEPLTNLLGYQENQRLVRQDSFLGQLMKFFVPDLKMVMGNEFNLDQDLKNKHDNFNWLINGVMNFLVNVMRPTNYSQFIQQILAINKAFEIEETLKYFSKTKNIQSGEYIINYNLGLVEPRLGYQKTMKKISYSLVFAKEHEADNYQFKLFRKN
jgi:uncharacterized membrane protein